MELPTRYIPRVAGFLEGHQGLRRSPVHFSNAKNTPTILSRLFAAYRPARRLDYHTLSPRVLPRREAVARGGHNGEGAR